jgi:tetratricopeptide (TPR) repeat protein
MLAALAFGLDLGWTTIGLLTLPLLLLEIALRGLVHQRRRRFESSLFATLQAGRVEALLPLLQAEWLLRFAAPPYYLQSKRGLINARLGRWAIAADLYRDALEEAPGKDRLPLTLGLAEALTHLGRDDEAENRYRLVLENSQNPPHACAQLARLILKRGGDAQEAQTLFRRAIASLRDGRVRCELALSLIATGQREEAAEHVELAAREMAEYPSSGCRDLLHQARAALTPPSSLPQKTDPAATLENQDGGGHEKKPGPAPDLG